MTRDLRIGVAGCGRLAEAGYVPALALTDGIALAAIADPDAGRRREVAVASGTSPSEHDTAAGLLAEAEVDAIVIASPPTSHEADAEAAVAAGVCALVEKPPAPDAAGAERIAALSPAPWIGFNRRFSLGWGLADVVPEGGSVALELRYRRFSWSPVSVRDPALIDLAPHLADLALRAGIGEPRAVRASSRRPERVRIEVEGERATARLACACDRPHRERAAVRDAAGSIVAARRIGGAVRGGLSRLAGGPHPLVSSLAAQLGELALAARGARPPNLASAVDGAAAMAVVGAAAESLAHGGRWVAVHGAELGAA